MILTADYHTHTIHSHGKGTVMENALHAKELGLKEIAITDHGFSHPIYKMKHKEISIIKEEIAEAEKQTGVKILFGIESNILGISGRTDLKEVDYGKFDIFLAGLHKCILYDHIKEYFITYGANLIARRLKGDKPSASLIKRNTEVYINTIKNNPIDILVHPNYHFFADPVEVAKCCRDYGTLFEIDSRKTHLSDEDWQKVDATGVYYVIDSDAHLSSNVGNVKDAMEMIERTGISKDRIMNIDGRVRTFSRFKDYKEKHL